MQSLPTGLGCPIGECTQVRARSTTSTRTQTQSGRQNFVPPRRRRASYQILRVARSGKFCLASPEFDSLRCSCVYVCACVRCTCDAHHQRANYANICECQRPTHSTNGRRHTRMWCGECVPVCLGSVGVLALNFHHALNYTLRVHLTSSMHTHAHTFTCLR